MNGLRAPAVVSGSGECLVDLESADGSIGRFAICLFLFTNCVYFISFGNYDELFVLFESHVDSVIL